MSDALVILLVLIVTAAVATILWLSAYPIVAVVVGVIGLAICWIIGRA
ncbi:hypothetical protein [Lacticaseibacillus thailandensis]|nr:hypothetical protein [Lacticaseibacillus thailandensis]